MGLESLKIQLDYHKRIVESLKENISFLEAKEEKEVTKDLFKSDRILGFNYQTKIIYVSEFTEELIKYKKLGWTIQKEIF